MSSRTNSPSSGKESTVGPVAAPKDVRASFVLWLTAVGAGVAETVIRVIFTLTGDPESNGLLLRVIVYAVAIYVAWQIRRGKGWARITLAVVTGVGHRSARRGVALAGRARGAGRPQDRGLLWRRTAAVGA